MILGPDRFDLKIADDIGKQSQSDVWFPYYPLCLDHSIDETYQMIYAVYQKMTEEYGADNISVLGFSSGAALAIGLCIYNNAQEKKLPMPRMVIASSPGCVPLTDEEQKKMQSLSKQDVMVSASFMFYMKDIMQHGKDVPTYMLSGICGDLTNFPEIHFYYGTDEVLYAEMDNFKKACEKYQVKYHMHIGKGMCHCYPMMPYFMEGKQAYEEMIKYLSDDSIR